MMRSMFHTLQEDHFEKEKLMLHKWMLWFIVFASNATAGQLPSIVKSHTENTSSSRHVYDLRLGGNLSFENSSTRTYSRGNVTFQPSIVLAISNTGRTVIHNREVCING